MGIWKRKGQSKQAADVSGRYKLADIYVDLRSKLLEGNPDEQGWQAYDVDGVWAVAMEMGRPTAVATLGVVADSADGAGVSFYFSNGGGIIGCGQHDGPRRTGRELLSAAPRFVAHADRAAELPLPAPGRIRFYIRTLDGTYTAEADEASLASGSHAFSELFSRAHAVITQVRLVGDLDARPPG